MLIRKLFLKVSYYFASFFILLVGLVIFGQEPVSADAPTWTFVDAVRTDHFYQAVDYGDRVFVAISSNSTTKVIRSADGGQTWTGIAGMENNPFMGIAYGDGVWVAVAHAGTNRVMRSTDAGLTWTAVAAAEDNDWMGVAYGDGVWVAVSASGANRVMRSTDAGLTWTAVAAAEANDWKSVEYGDGVWVAVSASGANRVMRSIDAGLTWTAVNVPAGGWYSVAYGDGVWIATPGGDNDEVLLRSTDAGLTWTTVTVPGSNIWKGIEYGDGVWVAVGNNENVLHSTDAGLTWIETDPPDPPGFSLHYVSVAYGDGAWVTVGGNIGSRGIMYSGSLLTTVPDPPTNVTGAAGDTQATISWDTPADNGGEDITAYMVTANPDAATCTTSTTSCTITGLTNGTAYTFTVVATNTVGNSDTSAVSSPMTPVGVAVSFSDTVNGLGAGLNLTEDPSIAAGGDILGGIATVSDPQSFTVRLEAKPASGTTVQLAVSVGPHNGSGMGASDISLDVDTNHVGNPHLLAAGEEHTCAITGGTVKCWGDNTYGQLGNGSTVDSLVPVEVTGLTGTVQSISAGVYHTCAIAGGGAFCWGQNSEGQLGDGTTIDTSTPAVVTGLEKAVTDISAGLAHSCAVVNGTVKCWGGNTNGQLGNNSTENSLPPV